MGKITFSKFQGDREAKTCDVFHDGEIVGVIEVINAEVFQSRASMLRTIRFEEVHVALTGKHSRDECDATFNVVDGYDRASGIRAAKALLKTWLA